MDPKAIKAGPALNQAPIGIFDSGIGGLSILREIQRQLPNEKLLYFADQAHVPYGSRSLKEVHRLSFQIVNFLLEQGAKLITVACNTASAASLHDLRAQYPETPFVGMEPAVKPAAENTQSHIVGVLATPATFQGSLFASVVERFAEGVTILQETLPGLVEQIERGQFDSPDTRKILEHGVQPLLQQGADTLVLACTHFPFIIPLLKEIVGDNIRVVDPSPAIARQVDRLLTERGLHTPHHNPEPVQYMTSGHPGNFETIIKQLGFPDPKIVPATWDAGELQLQFA